MSEIVLKSFFLPADFAHVSLLVFEMLVETMTFETRVSPKAGTANFAVKRRFGIVNFGNVSLEFPVNARTEGAFVDYAVILLHVTKRVLVFDFFSASATRLKG